MVEIEGWSYIFGNNVKCWTIDHFDHFSHKKDSRPPVVAVGEDGIIKGYLLYRLREAVVEIVKLVVDPFYRREGVGSILVEKMAGKLSKRYPRIVMRVSDRETHYHHFLKKNNFNCYKVRSKDYCIDGIYGDNYCFEYKKGNK
jgi:ribosomal protein S18 acetylase RimI-like enzyme